MKDFLNKFDKKKLFNSRKRTLLIAIACLIVLILIFKFLFKSNVKKEQTKEANEITLTPALAAVSEEQLWRQSIQEKFETESKKLSENISNLALNVEGYKKEDLFKQDTIKDLENKINEIAVNVHALNEAQKQAEELPRAGTIRNIVQNNIPLENSLNSSDYKPTKTSENYIPAGSFAKAVLLSGVDASTSLNSQSDPDPVLIRITDHGTLPRRFKSDLKDCHIIASSYGDLSSERAKIRLEKLSCTEKSSAEIIETEIAGYVTGEDGRQGVRGSVVSTEGKLLGNSLLSGVLSGLSNNFISQSQGVSLMPSNNNRSTSDRFKSSAFEGATTGLDRLSNYYIQRAESLQPVVQVGAGRKVDVIFTQGVFFGTTNIKKELAKKRDSQVNNK